VFVGLQDYCYLSISAVFRVFFIIFVSSSQYIITNLLWKVLRGASSAGSLHLPQTHYLTGHSARRTACWLSRKSEFYFYRNCSSQKERQDWEGVLFGVHWNYEDILYVKSLAMTSAGQDRVWHATVTSKASVATMRSNILLVSVIQGHCCDSVTKAWLDSQSRTALCSSFTPKRKEHLWSTG
jgi:hypothetical protein